MTEPIIWVGGQRLSGTNERAMVDDGLVDFVGERCYRISHFDRLRPFLIPVVSASDHWMFLSSAGGLTAGRGSAERALFPYQSVDRLHDSAASTGPFAALLVELERGERLFLWEPFSLTAQLAYRVSRHLYKSTIGHRVFFEEINHDLGLTWCAEWTTSERFGFVHSASLTNRNPDVVGVRLVHGLRNLLPAGMPRRLIDEMSCLTDAYKRAEVVPKTNLAVLALSAGITDQPIALEALIASVAWSEGLPEASVLLSDASLGAFRFGARLEAQTEARGVRSTYALHASLVLEPDESRRWAIIADCGLSQAAVEELASMVSRADAGRRVRADIEAGARRLRAIVGAADGLQFSGDEVTTAHHFANTLFNVMRGGVFRRGSTIPVVDFVRFIRERNRRVASHHAAWLATLPDALPCSELRRLVRERGEADLERLSLEYLPLSFSRRHGDPSRPWNRFAIRLRDGSGGEVFEYEGNWRDIFQNWEALGMSCPVFLEHMVAKFANASTLDGHNPYRLTRGGAEWEVPAPDDPWAGIGYWGDHQIVYLLELLDAARRFVPERLRELLEREIFSYVAVPYRIATCDEMRGDPRATIRFLPEEDAAIRAREVTEGSDARLVCDAEGRVLHVTLVEKLLLTTLARLANLIPGGGIWMNTQRPEWNDANNALAGWGVSGVTLAHLRRFLVFCGELFADLAGRDVALSGAVCEFADEVLLALDSAAGREAEIVADPVARRTMVDQLARAGTDYRASVYAHGPGQRCAIAGERLLRLLTSALPLVEASIRALRRSDGLYHAYRLLRLPDERSLILDDLPLMLEGQVAALSSGLCAPDEAVLLLRRLRASSLYCPKRRSYLLYPDAHPPGFLERNIVRPEQMRDAPLLSELLAANDGRLVVRDVRGVVRFQHELVNRAALDERLGMLAADPRWADAVRRGAEQVSDVYEAVFGHRAFTGRSGAMFAYEGLGSVYWHMVSKLVVVVQECHARAAANSHDAAGELARVYAEIRDGLGFNKLPVEWGAFPIDPHSHTPAHAGAQQPGMTGQVKESILARWGELGVEVSNGRLGFAPRLLRATEFLDTPASFSWFDAAGRERTITVPARSLAFTFCATLVIYTLTPADVARACVTRANGGIVDAPDAKLSAEDSADVFERSGRVASIHVYVPQGACLNLHTHATRRGCDQA